MTRSMVDIGRDFVNWMVFVHSEYPTKSMWKEDFVKYYYANSMDDIDEDLLEKAIFDFVEESKEKACPRIDFSYEIEGVVFGFSIEDLQSFSFTIKPKESEYTQICVGFQYFRGTVYERRFYYKDTLHSFTEKCCKHTTPLIDKDGKLFLDFS